MLEELVPASLRRVGEGAPTGAPLVLVHEPIAAAAFGAGSPAPAHAPFSMSIVIAGLAHLGLVAALSWAGEASLAGANGTDASAESVEVSLVSSLALAAHRPLAATATASTGQIDPNEGAPTPSEAPDQSTAVKPEPAVERAKDVIEVAPDVAPDPEAPQLAVAERAERRQLAPQAETAPEIPKEAVESQAKQRVAMSAPAAAKGGEVATGEQKPQSAVAGAVAASPGEVSKYATSIVEVLGRHRPKAPGPGKRGTVKIAFVIGDGGSIANVRVSQTSGQELLDQAALSALQAVKFPPPPKGMTEIMRTYEVPYHFR